MCTSAVKDTRRKASWSLQIHAGNERLSMNVNKERPPQQLLDEAYVVLDIAVYWVEEKF